jgi:hypothetical protein
MHDKRLKALTLLFRALREQLCRVAQLAGCGRSLEAKGARLGADNANANRAVRPVC